jgi:Flp pilus assembly pilin Flp
MNAIRKLSRTVRALHRDERGADMVEYVLLVAAVALPLLGIFLIFREQLWEMFGGFWERIMGRADIEQ